MVKRFLYRVTDDQVIFQVEIFGRVYPNAAAFPFGRVIFDNTVANKKIGVKNADHYSSPLSMPLKRAISVFNSDSVYGHTETWH
jgi:hypothetical protein